MHMEEEYFPPRIMSIDFLLYYLLVRVTERGRESQRSSTFWFKPLMATEGGVEARSQELHLICHRIGKGPSPWSISCCFCAIILALPLFLVLENQR